MKPLHLSGIDRLLTPVVLGSVTFGDSVDAPLSVHAIRRCVPGSLRRLDVLAATINLVAGLAK